MAKRIRVLVVDDSSSVRSTLRKGLEADPAIEVVATARDGLEALKRVSALQPDVVTMDIEMPNMDGLGALERIMSKHPIPVVMVSSLTREGAEITIKALELGAVDFALKTASRGSKAVRGLIEELTENIHQAATANVEGPLKKPVRQKKPAPPKARKSAEARKPAEKRVVVIASSTGGPQALRMVVPLLPADLPVPVLIVQHLPASFTARMAESLNKASALTVEEARPGKVITSGKVYVAPGGVHMVVTRAGSIRLNLDEPECSVRPSANTTMESAVSAYGDGTLGVVLTGMGSDGTRGAGLIKKAGGEIIAENESTCVVYGMPKSVVQAGYADRIVPLPLIASEIAQACQARQQRVEVSA